MASIHAEQQTRRPRAVTMAMAHKSDESAIESVLQVRVALLIESLGSGAEVARLLDVNRSQPSQWRRGNEQPGPRTSQLLLDLDYVVAKARQAWSGRAAVDWLTGANSALDGARPIDVLRSSGITEVIRALDVAMA